MKSQLMIIATLGALLAVGGPANSAEKELSKHQVPKAVIDAFEKDYPNIKASEFEKETFDGKTAYEMEYKENGKEYALLYGDDGALLQKEEEIDGKSLPKPVAQAVKKAHPKAKIKEVEKLMTPDGLLTGYEVEIKTGKKEVELELDTDGKILRTEKE